MFTDLNVGSAVPNFATGYDRLVSGFASTVTLLRVTDFRWQANAFTHVTFSVPDNWKSGRIWVREWRPLTRQAADISMTRVVAIATSTIPTPPPNAPMGVVTAASSAIRTPAR